MPVKISTSLPNCREGRLNPIGVVDLDWLRRVTARAEDLGYYSLWLNEFLQTDPSVKERFDQAPNYFDPLIAIADLARQTERIRFVTSTIVLPHHHPVLLSRQVSTLDVVTQGRITLGIGLGGSADEFRRMRGDLGSPNRGQMMDEFVQALRALWEQPLASFQGQYVNFQDVEAFPKPLQAPLPIFMAGDAPGVIARLGRFGQGWIDASHMPDEIKARIAELQRELASAGRERTTTMEITRQFYVSLGLTDAEAEDNMQQSVPATKTPPPPQSPSRRGPIEVVLKGTSDYMVSRLKEYIAAGVTEICAIFYSPTADRAIWQMERFAKTVIPELSGTD